MSYFRLPSYNNSYGDCYRGTKNEPCWGDVNIIDNYEDEYGTEHDIFACEGHQFAGYELSRHAKDDVAPQEDDY